MSHGEFRTKRESPEQTWGAQEGGICGIRVLTHQDSVLPAQRIRTASQSLVASERHVGVFTIVPTQQRRGLCQHRRRGGPYLRGDSPGRAQESSVSSDPLPQWSQFRDTTNAQLSDN